MQKFLKKVFIIILLFVLLFALAYCVHMSRPVYVKAEKQYDYVVLLHGMRRSSASMDKIEKSLKIIGYKTINVDYPSADQSIEELSGYIHNYIIENYKNDKVKIHFVTHSMGGVLVRYYLMYNRPKNLGRVVMLAPPNQGTEMSDFLQDTGIFELVFGQAGVQLGTNEKSIIHKLQPVDYELGVVMGNISLNPIASVVVKGKDDGLVSHKSSKLPEMTDSIIVPSAHSFIMFNNEAVRQIIYFLQDGEFKKLKER